MLKHKVFVSLMVFIGFKKKINTVKAKEIRQDTVKEETVFVLSGRHILNFELCGIILEAKPRYIKICDFHGFLELYKSSETTADGTGSHIFTVKPFAIDSKVAFFCKSIRKSTLYEEIAYNLEVESLIDNLCL